MSSKHPKLVLDLSFIANAWIVGSAADPSNTNARDFDMVVPYSQWQNACMLIPSDAKPNHFGGWKCISEGVEVDVWPGELSFVMAHGYSTYCLNLKNNVRWKRM